ncbi:MAG TPA: enoyl-CoA hydratase/isomerase family protein [Aliidongia sp.]|nr:enoyl-CoA hydratase/isomerase family protein [Aliidongia sp.]
MVEPNGSEEVLVETRGPLGILTLNRPKALNALNLGMIDIIEAALEGWGADPGIGAVLIRGAGGRAFCAGGDVRVLGVLPPGPEADYRIREYFAWEYRLNYRIHTFAKPFIAWIDGVTMGGGCGLSLHGSHIVATERTMVAMPETVLGLFPDVGATWFLNELEGEMGVYLGLSGVRLKSDDLLALGLASHVMAADRIETLISELASQDALDAESVERVLDRHAAEAGTPIVAARAERVDALFGGSTVEAIVEALEEAPEEWAREALATFRRASPTSLKLTLRQLRGGRGKELAEMLRIEYRLAVRTAANHDFREGVRAILVDKDNSPRWQPDRLEDVGAARIESYFAPFADSGEELAL